MPLERGVRLGPYIVVGPLGLGGMGEVYRAHDPRLDRDVAIKVLPTAMAPAPDRLARFEQEARATAALNHPNILSVYDVGSYDGRPYIVSELLEGESLRDTIGRGRAPVAKAVEWADQICQALAAAHDKGIVHRDLKPENLFVTTDGRVKVLDFGLAKLLERPEAIDGRSDVLTTPEATAAGLVVGTAGYMSPEQVAGRPIDPRTDIFAVGCVLYELLSGRRAFRRDTTVETLNAILKEQPSPLNTTGVDVPAGLERIVCNCLEKAPAQRFQAARDLSFALREHTGRSFSSSAAMPHRPSVRRWVVAGAAAILVASAGWIVWRQRDVPPAMRAPGTGPVRLAVLPFENLSRQAADDWLAGAFSDSLTLGLRDAENLVVVNRERIVALTGSMHAVDGSALQRLSRDLGVRFYVTGSYQRVGEDLRVVARLVDAAASNIILQESLTDRFANLLQLEDDLARRFSGTLRNAPTSLARVGTSSLPAFRTVAEANDLYLTGRFRDAIQRLNVAVAQDERYPEAWALLGKSYAQLLASSVLTRSESASELRQQALRASRRATELDPGLYEAQLALALSYRADEQIEAWRLTAQKAIALNPRLPEAHSLLGSSYFATPAWGCGRSRDADSAERLLRRALELDPQSDARRVLIYHLAWAGREADALTEADEAVRRMPKDPNILRARATALLWLGRPDDLERQLHDIVSLAPRSIQDDWEYAVVDLLRGREESAATQFAVVIAQGPQTIREIDTGRIYLQVGRGREAVRHLAHAFSTDASCAKFVAESPGFRPYRADPAFSALLLKQAGPATGS